MAMNKVQFDIIIKEAQMAAESAVATKFPIQSNPNYRNEGACGFAWVNILSGRGNFAKFAKEELNAHKNYGGKGINIWYSQFYNTKGNQSVYRHEIACDAAAQVFKKYGIKCQVGSRLD